MNAIGNQDENRTQHILFCMLSLQEDARRLDQRAAKSFRDELMHLIQDVDTRWKHNRSWQSLQGYLCREFNEYPALNKYLAALDALINAIEKQVRQYGLSGKEDVRLIVYYNQAFRYNTPWLGFAGPGQPYYRNFRDVAKLAAHEVGQLEVPFEKVYLLNALEPEAFEIYPVLLRCN